MFRFIKQKLTLILALLTLAACSSNVPLLIRQPDAEEIPLREAQLKSQELMGTRVRWGGDIVRVENLEKSTLVEILAKPLSGEGKPQGDKGEGRFIARFPEFIDPMRYPKERLLSVTGRLAGKMNRKIGEYRYNYPMVDVIAHHLWPEPVVYPPPPYFWEPYPWRPHYRHHYPHPYWW